MSTREGAVDSQPRGNGAASLMNVRSSPMPSALDVLVSGSRRLANRDLPQSWWLRNSSCLNADHVNVVKCLKNRAGDKE